ncbi:MULTISPECIES: hypothetical protein [unclassified Arthrobacter]
MTKASYRDAATEFEWARDLYRSPARRDHLARARQLALERARELTAVP